jgi:FMN phosphatase YigB (HAD superfamily)
MIGDDLECDVHGSRLAGWRQVHYDPTDAPTEDGVWNRIRDLQELLNLDLT